MTVMERGARRAKPQQTRRRRQDIDIATTKPGTPGGIFMRQFWHAICRSEDLPPGRAMPIRIMSEDYTLFRGHGGKAQVMAHRCPHRGALLHLGWVEGNDLRCVYHGWKYDCTGQCNEAPAEKPGFEKKVKVQTWPTEHVPCNYLQSFENSMDEVHVAYTHSPGGSHSKLAEDLPLITAEEKDWGLLRFGRRPKSGMVRHTLHYAPNIVRVIVPPLHGMDGVGGWPEITFHFTPVDDENHLWIITAKVLVTGAELETYKQRRAEFYRQREAAPKVNRMVDDIWAAKISYAEARHPELVIVQDIAVQAGQGRVADRDNELLGRSDAGIAAWRRILMRELRAIAEGGKVKKWKRPPEDVIPIVGIDLPDRGKGDHH